MTEKRKRLIEDVVVGLGLALLVVLLVVFALRAEPSFIYQAF